MKHIERGWTLLLTCMVLAGMPSDVFADARERSYQSIVDRNPFDIRPPQPVVAPAPPPPTNPPAKGTLKLTGFTTLRDKRAYFVWMDERTRTNETITLALNQERDGLKVLDIDDKNRAVKVVHHGIEKLMTFASDGITNMVAVNAGPGLPGAVRNVAGGVAVAPGGMTTALPLPRAPNVNTSSTVPPPTILPGLTPTPTAAPTLRTIPSRQVRTGRGGRATQPSADVLFNPTPTAPQQPSLSAEEQMIILEAQRMANPDLPPTPGIPPPPLPGVPQ